MHEELARKNRESKLSAEMFTALLFSAPTLPTAWIHWVLFSEFSDELLTGFVDLGGDDDFNFDIKVSPIAGTGFAPFASKAKAFPARGSGGDADADMSFQGRYVDRGPQNGFGNRDGDFDLQIAPVTSKVGVRLDMDHDDEISRLAFARGFLSLARQSKSCTVLDAGRNFDAQLLGSIAGKMMSNSPPRRAV
jgi:hypothetical protein